MATENRECLNPVVFRPTREIREAVDQLARIERRPLGTMIRLVIEDGLRARGLLPAEKNEQ